ncbi:MAG: hypothetical protein ABL907_12790, partial [Hyphomicrobium sp.]
ARPEHQHRSDRPARPEHQNRSDRPAHAARPARDDTKPRTDRSDRGGDRKGSAPKGNAPANAGGGEKRHWDGQRPPKFLNGNAPRSGGRPQAKPAN